MTDASIETQEQSSAHPLGAQSKHADLASGAAPSLDLCIIPRCRRVECPFWVGIVPEGADSIQSFSQEEVVNTNLDAIYAGKVQVSQTFLLTENVQGLARFLLMAPLSQTMMSVSARRQAPSLSPSWIWDLCEQLTAWQPKSLGICLSSDFCALAPSLLAEMVTEIASSLSVQKVYLEVEPMGLNALCALGLDIKGQLGVKGLCVDIWHP
ncbi:MAG: hypothetical protein OXT67_02570 [Zetaproteobacteria bacterium]|nr:hypothetical protein [Zetaproteobacteria bacterium]